MAVGLANLISWFFFDGAYNEFSKPLLMPLLMFHLYFTAKRKVYLWTLLLFTALVFSWGGDLALMLDGKYFLLGVGSFFVTQVLYSAIFYKTKAKLQVNRITMLLLVCYGLAMLYLLLPSAGTLKIAITIYSISLLTMTGLAWSCKSKDKPEYDLMVAIGATLFLISDSLIAANMFAIAIPKAGFWIMSSYILAQYLITESVILRNN
ncbi:MAG: putative membrane protein YhhN [Cyclobacteriaceae bacterium]|jgi:uncharacterized membrane protein YhhN